MVLYISIEANKKPLDISRRCHAYTIRPDHHCILTVVTSSDRTLSQWPDAVVKATKNKLRTLLVGVSVDRRFLQYTKGGVRDNPYDLLNLCVGYHCVIYYLPDRSQLRFTPRSLRSFFDNPRVVAVGMDMEAVAKKKLERHNGIKIKNPTDLRSMAVEGLKGSGEHLDLGRYDLDKLAKTVLGTHVDVVRPEEKPEWYGSDEFWWYRELSLDKVPLTTIDAYLCFLVGSELLHMINDWGTGGASFSYKNKSKRKSKIKKRQAVKSGN